MKKSKLVNGAVATIVLIAFSMPAIALADAGESLEGKSEKVNFADLNVEKEAGAQQLYRRLQQASKRVCGVESLKIAGSISAVSRSHRCYRETMDAAIVKIDNVTLTQIHAG